MKLPLFPLNTVLFPGCMLDLQLFEPRYLDMLGRCLKAGQGFGVVSILEGHEVGEAARSFSLIGCEALIRDWQQQANGLLGIRVEGGRRFRVEQSSVQADQLRVAEVTWLPALPNGSIGDDQSELLFLLEALGRHPVVVSLGMGGSVASQTELADRLAYLLPFSPAQKQQLLEMDAPAERLQMIQVLLEQLKDTPLL